MGGAALVEESKCVFTPEEGKSLFSRVSTVKGPNDSVRLLLGTYVAVRSQHDQ
jgi:hypothetical protein